MVSSVGRVEGPLLVMNVTQSYLNNRSAPLAALVALPTDLDAALLGLRVRRGGYELAEAIIEDWRCPLRLGEGGEFGKPPIRLMELRPGLLGIELGILQPGERAEVEFRYAQPLRLDRGALRLVLLSRPWPEDHLPPYIPPGLLVTIREKPLRPLSVPWSLRLEFSERVESVHWRRLRPTIESERRPGPLLRYKSGNPPRRVPGADPKPQSGRPENGLSAKSFGRAGTLVRFEGALDDLMDWP
jgi:hypothetical protein